tara:strand:+ start:7511 stop:8371 length:861 start_codon:yes stop_codon:yes gene_type:complete
MTEKKAVKQIKSSDLVQAVKKEVQKEEKKASKAVKKTAVTKAEEKKAEGKEVSSMPKIDDSGMLVPVDTYLKAGLHIGTKFRTKYMKDFIYKVRDDGLTVLNVQAIDERIRTATEFVSKYAPEDIVVVGKRENCWRPIKLFVKITGATAYAGRYHPGILTNPNLEDFREAKLVIVTDPWPDKDALRDAVKVGAVTVALCDTNNDSNYVDLVVACNNKGRKSLGLFFWILAREYMKNRNPEAPEITYTVEDFIGDESQRAPKKRRQQRSFKGRPQSKGFSRGGRGRR